MADRKIKLSLYLADRLESKLSGLTSALIFLALLQAPYGHKDIFTLQF